MGPMNGASETPILALIPAYNEETRLAPVVAAAREQLPVLVVDDGSRDATADVAAAEGATVIRQKPNQGKGAALQRGFRWALDREYAAVITLDADGQHDPAEILTFRNAFAHTRADLIIGARNFQQMPALRRLANWSGGKVLSWAMGHTVHDNQSGYRLVSRRLMEAMLTSHEGGFEFEVEMIITCVERGYHLGWVPIRTIYGDEPSHINNWQHFSNFLRIVWETWRRRVRAWRRNSA